MERCQNVFSIYGLRLGLFFPKSYYIGLEDLEYHAKVVCRPTSFFFGTFSDIFGAQQPQSHSLPLYGKGSAKHQHLCSIIV